MSTAVPNKALNNLKTANRLTHGVQNGKMLPDFKDSSSPPNFKHVLCSEDFTESQNCLGWNHFIPALLPWAATAPTRPDCLGSWWWISWRICEYFLPGHMCKSVDIDIQNILFSLICEPARTSSTHLEVGAGGNQTWKYLWSSLGCANPKQQWKE